MAKKSLIFIVFAFASMLSFTEISEASAVARKERRQAIDNQRSWCIVKPSTDAAQLEKDIVYSCDQPPNPIYNCSMVQVGGPCYDPSNTVSTASVVMNIYYQNEGRQTHACYFNGSGLIVYDDPSYGDCQYPVFY